MIGLLARVIVGVVCAGAVYGIYKCLTRESIKEEINEEIQASDKFKEAFIAKYKGKNGDCFSFEILDRWDEPINNINLQADEISSDINIGDEILLY